jgi:hypothetical protein
LIDYCHGMTEVVEAMGQERADSAAAHDHDVHV